MSEDLISHLMVLPGQAMSFEQGQYLFHEGDHVRVIYFIVEGPVHLVRCQDDGTSLVLQRAMSGSILAEASLYSDTYHCQAFAMAPVRTIVWPRQKIKEHLNANVAFRDAWMGHLAREVQQARLHAEILSLKTVAARLSAWVDWRAGQMPEKGEWKEVAEQIGVSAEALYREMAKRRKIMTLPQRCSRAIPKRKF